MNRQKNMQIAKERLYIPHQLSLQIASLTAINIYEYLPSTVTF